MLQYKFQDLTKFNGGWFGNAFGYVHWIALGV